MKTTTWASDDNPEHCCGISSTAACGSWYVNRPTAENGSSEDLDVNYDDVHYKFDRKLA